MSSDHVEVHTILGVLTVKVAGCREKLGAKFVGNALYGLQRMSSEHFEVRTLLLILTRKVAECQGKLDARAVGGYEQRICRSAYIFERSICEGGGLSKT